MFENLEQLIKVFLEIGLKILLLINLIQTNFLTKILSVVKKSSKKK